MLGVTSRGQGCLSALPMRHPSLLLEKQLKLQSTGLGAVSSLLVHLETCEAAESLTGVQSCKKNKKKSHLSISNKG